MVFPTRPVWIYQLTQGIHVTAGIACFPLLFAKLFTVFPELFQSPAGALVRVTSLERASIALFVAASLMQITIGLLNTYQLYALFGFSFRLTHYALSWIVVGSLAIHIGVKLPIIARYWRKRDAYDGRWDRSSPARRTRMPNSRCPMSCSASRAGRRRTGVTGRLFAWMDRDARTARARPRSRETRRGFLATVAVATAVLVAHDGGPVVPASRPAQRLRTAQARRRPADAAGQSHRKGCGSARDRHGTRVDAHDRQRRARARSSHAPGWRRCRSTTSSCRSRASRDGARTPHGAGPRLSDLLDAVGAAPDAHVRITSLQRSGSFGVTEMQPEFARDPLTLVALELFGEELDIDHGYPARIIAPGRPGVLQTKWLSEIEVIA